MCQCDCNLVSRRQKCTVLPIPHTGDLFTPLTFLMYNLGDFLGRSLAGYQKKPLRTAPLVMYAVARAALIPALAFCNVITPHPWIFFAYFKWVASLRCHDVQ
jgi:hypothetical protein